MQTSVLTLPVIYKINKNTVWKNKNKNEKWPCNSITFFLIKEDAGINGVDENAYQL